MSVAAPQPNRPNKCVPASILFRRAAALLLLSSIGANGEAPERDRDSGAASECEITPVDGHVDWPADRTEVPDQAFFGCKKLKTIFIPSSVTSIGVEAFDSSNLEDIDFQNGSELMDIGTYAFWNCQKLYTIDIPPSVTRIGFSSFYYSNLAVANIGVYSNLEEIDSYAFSETKLHTINIPKSVTYIGTDAFENAGCDKTNIFKAGNNVVECKVVWGCNDSTEVYKGKGCAWVADNKNQRCPLCDGDICAMDYCKVTCNTC